MVCSFPLLLLLPSNNNNNASFFSFEAFVWHATWPSVGQVVFRYFSTTKSFFPARPLRQTKALTLRHSSSAFSKRISHHRFYHHTTNTQKAWKRENGSLALLIKYESCSDYGVTNLWFGLWRPLERKSLGTNSYSNESITGIMLILHHFLAIIGTSCLDLLTSGSWDQEQIQGPCPIQKVYPFVVWWSLIQVWSSLKAVVSTTSGINRELGAIQERALSTVKRIHCSTALKASLCH